MTKIQMDDYREVFTFFDRDKDGAISSDEVGAVIRSCGRNPTEEELAEIVKNIDEKQRGRDDLYLKYLQYDYRPVGTLAVFCKS